jgi:hypothetical protein
MYITLGLASLSEDVYFRFGHRRLRIEPNYVLILDSFPNLLPLITL